MSPAPISPIPIAGFPAIAVPIPAPKSTTPQINSAPMTATTAIAIPNSAATMPSNADSMTRIITSHTGEVMTRRTIAHPGIPSFSGAEYAAFCAAPCGTPFDAFCAAPCTAGFHSAPVAAPSSALCTAGFHSAPADAPCAPEEHASPGCTPRSLIMLSATFCGDSSSSKIFASFASPASSK